MKHYRDYIWEDGLPLGLGPIKENEPLQGVSYKIPADPYRKWISLEEYNQGQLIRIIYDSAMLDFRKLTPQHQMAWQKVVINETQEETTCLIRDLNDRVILMERYTFKEGRCSSCEITSPHGLPLSSQKILLTEWGDPFNGLTLYDSNKRPVMVKKYTIDSNTGEFLELIEENWKIKNGTHPLPNRK